MRRLHDHDSRGVERRRTVVTRADGTKVVRVEKRRRTYDDSEQSEKKNALQNKKFLIGLCLVILLTIGGMVGGYMYRLTTFNTQDFVNHLKTELAESWGGQIELRDVALDGRSIKATRVNVTFPENSCLSFVSLEGVSGELSMSSIFMGKIKGESLNVSKAIVGLRPGYVKFEVPRTGKELPFSFKRYTSPRLEVGYAHDSVPFELNKSGGAFFTSAEAYVRLSKPGVSGEYVFDLSEQKLKIKGWPLMAIDTGSIIVDSEGIKQLNLSGKLDQGRLTAQSGNSTPLAIKGVFRMGRSFDHQVWTLTGRNFDLTQLLGSTFSPMLKVQMGQAEVKDKLETNLTFALPVGENQVRPAFKGNSGTVTRAALLRLPVYRFLTAITSRKAEMGVSYSTPVLSTGSFSMETNGLEGNAILKDINLTEQSFLTMNGSLVAKEGKLTGNLKFTLPAYMLDMSKQSPDVVQEGNDVIVNVRVGGSTVTPEDNSAAMLKRIQARIKTPAVPGGTTPTASPSLPTAKPSVDGFM